MSTASENSNLPLVIEPRRLARQERQLHGYFSPDRLQRLPEIAERIQSPLAVSLNFFIDEIGRPRISGNVKASVFLTCQRCLEAVDYQVNSAIDLTILASEDQASGLQKEADWLVLEEDTLNLLALLEEEVILALPFVPKHSEDQCQVPEALRLNQVRSTDVSEHQNPFDVLAELKKGS